MPLPMLPTTNPRPSPAQESPLVRLTLKLPDGRLHTASVHSTLRRADFLDEIQLDVVAGAISCYLRGSLVVVGVTEVESLAWEIE